MSWPVIALLAAATFAAVLLLFPASRAHWQALASALLIGLAGYALQSHPGLPGRPKARVETVLADPGASSDIRQRLAGRDNQGDAYMTIADAMLRHGQFANAATVLRGAVEKDPGNGQAWLGMANALTGHAEGALSPAALYAYRRASAADPAAPGPPFFLGLALIQNGRPLEGRDLWAATLARAPADAPWRPELQRRLELLDRILAQQGMAPVSR